MSVTLYTLERIPGSGGKYHTVANTWANGASTQVEPDGVGGLIQVVRDSAGRIIGSEIAELVADIEVH